VRGHQHGIPSLWLYKNKDRPTLYAALSLLHDLVPTTFDGTTAAFTEAYRSFGASDARWMGYWEPMWPVGTSDPRLKAGSYLKPGVGALTTVANLTQEEVRAELTFDRALLNLKAPRVLEVVDSRETHIEGSALRLGPGGWVLVRVGEGPE